MVADAAPGLIMDEIYPLDELRRSEVLSELFFVVLLAFVALVTALLATAGVYALMSFIVSRRTREIGIRTALGAAPGRVLKGIFLRTFVQLGAGVLVLVGLVIVGILGARSLGIEGGRTLWLSGAGVAVVLVTVGLFGCAIPVLRALRVQPTQAVRADG
jgi:putative ABC transport system permease protein